MVDMGTTRFQTDDFVYVHVLEIKLNNHYIIIILIYPSIPISPVPKHGFLSGPRTSHTATDVEAVGKGLLDPACDACDARDES